MRRIITLLAATGLVSALAFVAPLTATPGNGTPNGGAGAGNKYGQTTRTAADACQGEEDAGDGSLLVSITGAETLWPPNHKLVPVTLTATDADGDEVTLATEGAHDQYTEEGEEFAGSGNTDEDVSPAMASGTGTGSASTTHEVRAERAGTDQSGRTYTILYEATGGEDDSCIGSFDIFVPHDQRGGAGWK